METYRQFCPLSKAAEVLCERWTPLVLRELLLGSTRFNELQRGVPGMSPSLLSRRLKTLQHAGVIRIEREGRGSRYLLTEAGLELESMLTDMAVWGHRWVRSSYTDLDMDSSFLMIDIRRNLRDRRLDTPRRVVIEVTFRDHPRDVYWMVAEPDSEPDLCYLDPGYDVDVRMDCDLRALTMVWMGDMGWDEALRTRRIELSGPKPLVAKVPGWIGQHDLSVIERGVAAAV